ncbi:MAG: bifunctional hydroxymethylpyrimidine kinase/phosphomethylpyrimidine kinase [Firmicutes bacterium]|nr:bifunctional hydroxymethylpyrimidine kinase/phosphomethylpyrimidine kinase [Bacillota bacterium]
MLVIAGSDSGGGAGIAADLKTLSAHGVWGLLAITAVTAQNTTVVRAIHALEPEMVTSQIQAVVEDIGCDAVKVGMVPDRSTVAAILRALQSLPEDIPVVWDPVLAASTGNALGSAEAISAALSSGRITLFTPNAPEAAVLTGRRVETRAEVEAAAQRLLDQGARAVLIKGGHLPEAGACDYLALPRGGRWLEGERIAAQPTHGTGCVLASAAAAGLARGLDLEEAVVRAKRFVTEAIRAQRHLGAGRWPVDPCWEVRPWT